MEKYLSEMTRREMAELHREIRDQVEGELATRYALAKRHTIEDATEMDLVQYLMAKGGNA